MDPKNDGTLKRPISGFNFLVTFLASQPIVSDVKGNKRFVCCLRKLPQNQIDHGNITWAFEGVSLPTASAALCQVPVWPIPPGVSGPESKPWLLHLQSLSVLPIDQILGQQPLCGAAFG